MVLLPFHGYVESHCMDVLWFLLSLDIYLSCFQSFAITNNATTEGLVHVISYFCLCIFGIEFIKRIVWSKKNAQVILLDVAKFPSLEVIPFLHSPHEVICFTR